MSDSVRPHRWQPTRPRRPWDSPGKNTGVGCHFLLQCVKVKSLSRVRLFVILWTVAHQAPPSMGFSRQEYWSGLPFPSPRGLPNPGMEPKSFTSPAVAGWFFTTSATWKAPFDSNKRILKGNYVTALGGAPLLLLLSRFRRVRFCATP